MPAKYDYSAGPLGAEPNEIITFDDGDGPDTWIRSDLPRAVIALVDHDPAWTEQYSRLAEQILSVLGPMALGIEHVGSTSVPGLAAKPIIDIALVVTDPREESEYRPPLHSIGFELVIREPAWYQHRMFKHMEADGRTPLAPMCNLHVFGPRCPEVARMRLFRDRLRSNPDDRSRYQNAKRNSVAEANAIGETVMEYNARKQGVIRDIYRNIFRAEGWI
ncbi:MAG: GrpB family protein [Brevibacterium sp.]|nr:GrpB family protein [Brevibacterium sp.]MDN6135067.1 GrpB family protein [Brevibacterium sp.]MDN6175688.1 GrpB family protein [Brevibacterium sp.]MDN6189215.1 GrpB family protein [Brevibacterium sp.]